MEQQGRRGLINSIDDAPTPTEGCGTGGNINRSGKRANELLLNGIIQEYWQEKWLEAATRLCGVDDGIPRKLDRVNRLKHWEIVLYPNVLCQSCRQ